MKLVFCANPECMRAVEPDNLYCGKEECIPKCLACGKETKYFKRSQKENKAQKCCDIHCWRVLDKRGRVPRPRGRPFEVRLWEKVNKDGPNGCWLWTGGTTGQYKDNAYPHMSKFDEEKGRWVQVYVTRELLGPPPPGMRYVKHTCNGGTLCVNPDHLTYSESNIVIKVSEKVSP